MATTEKKTSKFPGLTLKRFAAAVATIIELRESSDFFVFLSRRMGIRLLGELTLFKQKYAEHADGNVDDKDARFALVELRNFLNTWRHLQDADSMVETLVNNPYSNTAEKLDDKEKEEFKTFLRQKVELVSSDLFTAALKERDDRLDTSVGPSFEDLDVEVVSARHDWIEAQKTISPFLRLRVRYSTSEQAAFPFSFFPPWVNAERKGEVKSFELECDESDIDLLIKRLRDAKSVLHHEVSTRADSIAKS